MWLYDIYCEHTLNFEVIYVQNAPKSLLIFLRVDTTPNYHLANTLRQIPLRKMQLHQI